MHMWSYSLLSLSLSSLCLAPFFFFFFFFFFFTSFHLFLFTVCFCSLPYQGRDGKYTHTIPPMKATCALKELLYVEETASLAESRFSDILAQLLLRLASCARLAPADGLDPLADAIAAFKQFLERAQATYVTEALDEADGWPLFANEMENNVAFTTIVAQLAQQKPDIVGFILLPLLLLAAAMCDEHACKHTHTHTHTRTHTHTHSHSHTHTHTHSLSLR